MRRNWLSDGIFTGDFHDGMQLIDRLGEKPAIVKRSLGQAGPQTVAKPRILAPITRK